MKIEIKEIENPKNFYNEVYGILRIYSKKLYQNPKKKITPFTTFYLRYCILCIVFLAYIILISMIGPIHQIYFICIGIIFMCTIIGTVNLIRAKNIIKKLTERKVDSILTIEKEGVSLENRIIKQKNFLKWDDMNYILIGKYAIGFMPKKESITQAAIYCSTKYLKEIEEGLKKKNQEKLLIKNQESPKK